MSEETKKIDANEQLPPYLRGDKHGNLIMDVSMSNDTFFGFPQSYQKTIVKYTGDGWETEK